MIKIRLWAWSKPNRSGGGDVTFTTQGENVCIFLRQGRVKKSKTNTLGNIGNETTEINIDK